jgi:hypothetical protein
MSTGYCSRKSVAMKLRLVRRALKVYECNLAGSLVDGIKECGVSVQQSTLRALDSKVRSCLRHSGGRQRALRLGATRRGRRGRKRG